MWKRVELEHKVVIYAFAASGLDGPPNVLNICLKEFRQLLERRSVVVVDDYK